MTLYPITLELEQPSEPAIRFARGKGWDYQKGHLHKTTDHNEAYDMAEALRLDYGVRSVVDINCEGIV